MIYKKLKKDILSGAVGVITPPAQPLPTNLVYTDQDNTLTGANEFLQPLIVPNANNVNEAVNKGQLEQAINAIPPVDLTDYAKTNEANTWREEQHYRQNQTSNHRIIIKGNGIVASALNGNTWTNHQVIGLYGNDTRLQSTYPAAVNEDVINKLYLDTQLAPFNQTIQDLQNTINDLQAKVQKLENYKAVIDPLILEFRDVFKAKVNDLEVWKQTAEPLINDYETNGAKLNRENTFRQKVKIIAPDNALSLVQDNNAVYVSIEKGDGTRRGYIGVGSSGTNIVNVWARNGLLLQTAANDIQFQPARQINASNKKLTGLADPTNPTDAVNLRSK